MPNALAPPPPAPAMDSGAGGGEGGVGGVRGESGEGGGGWAWTGARKTLHIMAGAVEGGGKCERWGAVRVWAVWAVRAAGVGRGGGKCERWGGGLGMDWEPVLEPLKHCFSWPGRLRWGR